MAESEEFLSDENDINGSRFRMDVGVWSSRVNIFNSSKNRAKSFSTMMSSCGIFLYDHPKAIKKYPNGFYSENIMFIPIDMYERAIELEPLAAKFESVNSYWNLTGLILIRFLTKMIEQKYDIEFSVEEKEKILLSATEYSFVRNALIFGRNQVESAYKENDKKNLEMVKWNYLNPTNYLSKIEKTEVKNFTKEIFNNKEPIFLSNKDISLFAEQNNLVGAKILKKQNDDASFIDYSLLKNKDMYEKDHPFNQLMGMIKSPSKIIDLLNLDKSSYQKKIWDLGFGETYMLFNAFENLTYEIVKESNTIDDCIRKISGIWSNFALETNEIHFEFLINILYDNVIQKFPEDNKKMMAKSIAGKIASSINENAMSTMSKREIFIDGLLRISDDCATVRTIIYPQNNKLNKLEK